MSYGFDKFGKREPRDYEDFDGEFDYEFSEDFDYNFDEEFEDIADEENDY